MVFTEEEKRDIHEIYIQNNYNKRQAQVQYARRYGENRTVPSLNTFPNVYRQVTETVSFKRKRQTITRDDNYYNEELDIILHFQGIHF